MRDLGWAWGARPLFEHFDLTVARHRFTALVGPNGAGKSTLISMICGLTHPQSGSVKVLGHDLSEAPVAALRGMGIVFQRLTLDLDLTVLQNLEYFAALRGMSRRGSRAAIDRNLERLGLEGRRGDKVRTLNGGHRRRLEIARALLHEPPLLILDEPTVGLDVPSRSAIVEHVHELCAGERLTVLWTTHLVDEIRPGDDLVVLHLGRVRAAGGCAEVLASTGTQTVLEAFNKLTLNTAGDGPG